MKNIIVNNTLLKEHCVPLQEQLIQLRKRRDSNADFYYGVLDDAFGFFLPFADDVAVEAFCFVSLLRCHRWTFTYRILLHSAII